MPAATSASDTIRILVATDNHVGFGERDPIRGDDSWRSFHEVLCLAKKHDVDMVLLAGDLFHENKPSRKSMYQVMRSLRMNCYGEKPCELEMLSDGSESLGGFVDAFKSLSICVQLIVAKPRFFSHVNYEDPDINVAIPVFSIHGNHDDPSGEGHLAALDLLQVSGLVNYYGKTPESDNILVKPVLLQKGRTKLALYGMSNVRDERLYRTFRDGKVKFFQPSTQKDNWFNLMSVHQNHHAYTETGYLPENFLPDFMDLVVWGHEHECLIEPRYNPEMSFHVMQPGSSVATSLVPGEAVTKHVAILKVTGKKFECETIQLKTIRPFIMKEIVLRDDPRMVKVSRSSDNRQEITRHLDKIVESLIKEAKAQWLEAQDELDEEDPQAPLPLVRLRVEYTPPENGHFDCENPQRFSNRFVGKVANVNDVVQFHRKKTTNRKAKAGTEMPEQSVMDQMALDTVKVDSLVREFLAAQSLTILPQNSFGDAVSQFVDKDDRHAMELFVEESLKKQVEHLVEMDDGDEDDLANAMDENRSKLEKMFASGHLKKARNAKLKPKPDNWDSDYDGEWADQPGAIIRSEAEDQDEAEEESNLGSVPPKPSNGRGRGRGRGGASTSARNSQATARKTKGSAKPPAKSTKSKRNSVESEGDVEEADVVMIDDDDEADEPPVPRRNGKTATQAPTRAKRNASPKKKLPAQQATLSFSQPATQKGKVNGASKNLQELSDDIISDDDDDDDDAFEPVQAPRRPRAGR
ncbi:MAG: meiotic recombination [Chrysothrix sp. TS-e1954]|nr:MAG: meiotic recombination [Chrysothrix sp. TS-e1954]